MSERDDLAYVRDILDAIAVIREYVEVMSWDDFVADRKTQDAVVRRLEVIGEASKRVGHVLKGHYPEVPWSEAARMRDKLIHGYFGIDPGTVWETVQHDLPPLADALLRIIPKEG